MLGVLEKNGRLCQPGNTNTNNVKSQVEREIQKTLVFQGVLENILMMRHYFQRVYENDTARFNELVSSGCFTFKFVSQLLLMIPAEELMTTNRQIMGVDHTNQVKFYLKYAQSRLQSLYSLRNLNTTDQGSSQHVPSGPSTPTNTSVTKGELKRIKVKCAQKL